MRPLPEVPDVTVVAFSARHGIMAADSRVVSGGSHFCRGQKVHRLKSGAVLGFAGDVDVRDLLALLERARPRTMPSRSAVAELRLEVEALLAFPSGVAYTVSGERSTDGSGEWFGEVVRVDDKIAALGSGASFAYGALEAGADPVRAVRVACRRDISCALPVQWEKLR